MDPNAQELDIHTISRRSVHGVFAVLSRQLILNLISFGASIVIITFLTPKDLGIYAAITAMQRIISFFTDFGLGAALVQKKESLLKDDLTTTFTVQTLITFIIFLIVLALSPLLLSLFKLDATGIKLLLAFVLTIFLSSFKLIPSILLERAIHFEKLVVPHIIEALIYNGVLVVLVLHGFRLDAYSWAVLLSALGGIPFYYYISPWKLSFGIKKSSLKHLHYGLQYQAKNILATIKDDLLTVILAKLLPFSALGYLNFAEGFAFFPLRFVTDSVTRVTFASYARMQGNKDYMRIGIEKSLFFVSLLMFPAMIGLILTGPFFIHFIPKWHAKWEPAIVSLVFFSLNAMVSSLSNVLVNFLDASGKVKITLRLMILWTILVWVLTLVFIHIYGFNGVAIASFLVTLTLGITVYMVRKIVPFSLWRSISRPLFATLGMAGVILLFTRLIGSDVLTLLLTVSIGALSYSVLLYLIAGKEIIQDYKYIFKHT